MQSIFRFLQLSQTGLYCLALLLLIPYRPPPQQDLVKAHLAFHICLFYFYLSLMSEQFLSIFSIFPFMTWTFLMFSDQSLCRMQLTVYLIFSSLLDSESTSLAGILRQWCVFVCAIFCVIKLGSLVKGSIPLNSPLLMYLFFCGVKIWDYLISNVLTSTIQF